MNKLRSLINEPKTYLIVIPLFVLINGIMGLQALGTPIAGEPILAVILGIVAVNASPMSLVIIVLLSISFFYFRYEKNKDVIHNADNQEVITTGEPTKQDKDETKSALTKYPIIYLIIAIIFSSIVGIPLVRAFLVGISVLFFLVSRNIKMGTVDWVNRPIIYILPIAVGILSYFY
jgi:hypothetical protein|tara:strand:+ start:60 stop:587 length:528 start_codon:yes stop_codon:yes gene_type:complete